MLTLHLIDISARVEWFRDTDSAAARAVAKIRDDPAEIAVTQPVALEVRAGTRRANLHAVDRILDTAVQLSVEPNIDFDVAGDLYLAARDIGSTVSSLMDCVIAAVAIRTSAVLLPKTCIPGRRCPGTDDGASDSTSTVLSVEPGD